MSDLPRNNEFYDLERRLIELVDQFPYPPTPDLATDFSGMSPSASRRLFRTRTAVAIIVLFLALLFVSAPPVRAAVAEFLQLGQIRIYLETELLPALNLLEPSPPIPDINPSLQQAPLAPPQTGTPVFEPLGLASLTGEQSVAAARAGFPFPSPLPANPADLGPPDRVFLQDTGGSLLLYVWEDHELEGGVKLSLLILGPGAAGSKGSPEILVETKVNGAPAVWLEGDHLLILNTDRGLQPVRLQVAANVLIWEKEGLTYRLEGRFSREEMVRIAESLE